MNNLTYNNFAADPKTLNAGLAGLAAAASLGMMPPAELHRMQHDAGLPSPQHNMSRKRSARTGLTKGSTRCVSPKAQYKKRRR